MILGFTGEFEAVGKGGLGELVYNTLPYPAEVMSPLLT